MRIPPWSEADAPRDPNLTKAILERRGGKYIALDRALLWSEPLARGWNTYLKAVRSEMGVSPRLREIAICTVARLTGAGFEFDQHWPDYVKAGGNERLRSRLDKPEEAIRDPEFSADERLAMRYALAMTRDIHVPEALFEEMRERFDNTQLVELTASIATYNMVARFLIALGI
ncbi:MAG TPA: hypothetical protein VLT89_09585 [Usitatibacter sp.]|nr:hypothetical protein [Usitatibacter sp.]